MPTSIRVLKPGEKVDLAKKFNNSIKGVVVQVLIEGADASVTYKVSWWNGKARVCEWLQAFEVDATRGPENKLTVGFANAEKQDDIL